MTNNERQLIAAMETLLGLEIRGHNLAHRLQFSTPARAILWQVTEALYTAKGADNPYKNVCRKGLIND